MIYCLRCGIPMWVDDTDLPADCEECGYTVWPQRADVEDLEEFTPDEEDYE